MSALGPVPIFSPRLYTKDGFYRLAKYSDTMIEMASSDSLDGAMDSQTKAAPSIRIFFQVVSLFLMVGWDSSCYRKPNIRNTLFLTPIDHNYFQGHRQAQ